MLPQVLVIIHRYKLMMMCDHRSCKWLSRETKTNSNGCSRVIAPTDCTARPVVERPHGGSYDILRQVRVFEMISPGGEVLCRHFTLAVVFSLLQ